MSKTKTDRPNLASATVELGGQTYIISPPPIRESKVWRAKLRGPFNELAGALEHDIPNVLSHMDNIESDQLGSISRLVQRFSGVLLGAVDQLLDLMFEYSPVLQADRERIEAEAYDQEALAAFVQILKLAYPFDQIRHLFPGRVPK